MLDEFILNTLDTFIVVFLWEKLIKEDTKILRLIFSVFVISTLITATQLFKLNFIVVYLIDIIVLKIVHKKDLKNTVFPLFLVLTIDILLQLILTLIINKFFYYDYVVKGIIIELIILIGVVSILKINFLRKNYNLKKLNNDILVYFILTLVIYVILFRFVWEYNKILIEKNLFFTIAIFSTLIISQIFTYLYVAKIVKEKENLKVSNEYNYVINEIVQEIKQRQHDFVNYKNTIRGIVEVIEDKDVKSEIISYMKDEDIHDNKINELIYIDNTVIKSIIYRTICKAKKFNVNFQYNIENNVLDDILSYHEISNILNNLLNNAFDEVAKEQCLNKNIEIKIYNEKGTSHLNIKNQVANCKEVNLNEMFTRGYSTKNSEGRGYGLYNIQQIINSHKGFIKVNIENEEIIFHIYFNNSSG